MKAKNKNTDAVNTFDQKITPKALREHRDYLLGQRFKKLYEVDRIRIDDCINKLAIDFALMPETIRKKLSKKGKE